MSAPAQAQLQKRLDTRFTRIFKCRVPIMGAPMAGVSGGSLAAATCHGGALGFIAAGHLTDENDLRRQVNIFHEEAPKKARLCLGFIGFSSLRNGSDKVRAVIEEYRPFAVQFFAPAVMGDNIRMAKDLGSLVVAQVGNERDARDALSAGADCIVAQGREAGGHGLRTNVGSSTLPLAERIAKIAPAYGDSQSSPLVLAAGGIVDGRGLAASLALGCDGCVFGTRLWASNEAMGSVRFKQLLEKVGPDQVLRTRVFDRITNSYSANPWPEPYDTTGVVSNNTTENWDEKLDELDAALRSDDSVASSFRDASNSEDWSIACVYAGEGVGCIDTVCAARDIIERAEEEAISAITSLTSHCVEMTRET